MVTLFETATRREGLSDAAEHTASRGPAERAFLLPVQRHFELPVERGTPPLRLVCRSLIRLPSSQPNADEDRRNLACTQRKSVLRPVSTSPPGGGAARQSITRHRHL